MEVLDSTSFMQDGSLPSAYCRTGGLQRLRIVYSHNGMRADAVGLSQLSTCGG